MLDVLSALKWVKTYIKYFGGNPNKITVAGQSSGGVLVSSLLLSPLVPSNLFQQMIIHSGTIFAPWSWSLDPVANAKDIATRANVPKNATIHEINEAFMKMNVYDLLNATNEHYVIENRFVFRPYCLIIRMKLGFFSRPPAWCTERIWLGVVRSQSVDHRIICRTNHLNYCTWAISNGISDCWLVLSKMKGHF